MDYHDVLSKLGILHAHPGGTDSTGVWMTHVSPPDAAEVLDLGCGNGATACQVASQWNANVTVLDIRPQMIRNALKLAEMQGVSLKGVTAPAESIPFPDDTFDFVICESILVFVELRQALHELHRVLKPSGQMIDVEMMVLRPVSEEWREDVRRIYGATQVPDLSGWKRHYREAGFYPRVLQSGRLESVQGLHEQRDVSLADTSSFYDPQVFAIIEANGRWMAENARQMGYGIFLLTVDSLAT